MKKNYHIVIVTDEGFFKNEKFHEFTFKNVYRHEAFSHAENEIVRLKKLYKNAYIGNVNEYA